MRRPWRASPNFARTLYPYYMSYRCPATSKEIRTGIDTDPARVAKMRSLKVAVACPYCPEGHIVTAESMFISDDLENLSEKT